MFHDYLCKYCKIKHNTAHQCPRYIQRARERMQNNKYRNGKKLSEQHKNKIRNKLLGIVRSEDTKLLTRLHHNPKSNLNFGLRKRYPTKETIEKIKQSRKGYRPTEETKRKTSESMKRSAFWKGKKLPEEIINKIRQARAKQIVPSKDTSIEIILQNILTDLNIPFIKHKPIHLLNGYFHQVDIFIEPNICIEADGNYWHNLPKQKIRDEKVNKCLTEQGYKVYRFWEHDIRACSNWINFQLESIIKE